MTPFLKRLRENHGGSEHLLNLVCGHLFAEPVQTISIFTRYKDETLHFWTPAHVEGSALAED